jgi:hypothetical protein
LRKNRDFVPADISRDLSPKQRFCQQRFEKAENLLASIRKSRDFCQQISEKAEIWTKDIRKAQILPVLLQML